VSYRHYTYSEKIYFQRRIRKMVDYSKYQNIKVEKKDKIATVTLNRPEFLNVMNSQTMDEYESVMRELSKDNEVRVIILTGAGKAFSAGGDIKGMKARTEDPVRQNEYIMGPEMGRSKQLILNMVDMEKPIICALNGVASGLGATIALFCDIIIAAKTARIGDPHVRVGIVAGDGGSVIWPLLVGPARAKEYLLTGDLVNADEAERIGLINKVVEPEQLYPTALAFAQRLAAGAPKAIGWTKLSINRWLKEGINLIMDTSLGLEWLTFVSKDHCEAVDAFLEKREPKYEGK
jgi:enoyl-CoA hydratase